MKTMHGTKEELPEPASNNFGGTRNGSPAPPMQLPPTGGEEMLVKGLERSCTKTAANHPDHLSSGWRLRRDQRSLHCGAAPTGRPLPLPGRGRSAPFRSRSSRTDWMTCASVWGSAPRRFTAVAAALCAPLRPFVPLPLADAQTKAR